MKARVIQSMTAQLDEEIDLCEGDIVTITSIIDDTWYRGFIGNRTGIFPSTHVELLPPYNNLVSQAITSTTQAKQPYETSSVSSRQIFKQCSESSDVDLNVSSCQIFKQDFESSDIGCNVSSPRVSKQCTENLDLGNGVSSRQLFKQCSEDTSPGISQLTTNFKNCENERLKSYSETPLGNVPHGVTLYPFCAQFDNELSFQEAETVNLIRYIDKYWMEGEIGGKKGIFPANYVKILIGCKQNVECETLVEEKEVCINNSISENSYVTVMYNFDAQISGDLSVREGDKVFVVALVNNDWCQVQNSTGQVGSVPCVYLSQVHDNTCQALTTDREDTFHMHHQNSDAVHMNSNDSYKYHMLSPEAMDLDTAMSRNLAELSMSVHYRHDCNSLERTGIRAAKSVTLETTKHCEQPHPQEPVRDADLELMESSVPIYGVELRRVRDDFNEKHSDLHKRESLDRIPHRPAPPAPMLGQEVSQEYLELVVHSDTSAADPEAAPLNINPDTEVTEELKAEDERKKNLEQRQNVISELVFTEKEFSRDMKITYETFNLHNPSFLESYGVDVKLLFGNILEVIHLSEDFTDQLLLALKGKSEENQCVGQCFLNMASRMKSVYSEYTVNHDNVLTFLEKYDSDPGIKRVLDKGVETLRYQISCFDMGSILIKPVQRVLKYPLIVNELIKYTEDDHEDKPDLLKAASAMMDVANEINENKRRKDIVVKYLEDNPLTISNRISRISLHSVAKKSTRIGALLSSSLGIKSGARDELYDEQENLFYTLDKMVRSFLKNAEAFVATLQETFFIKCLIVENIVAMYDEDVTFDVDKYYRIIKNISSQFLNEFKKTVNTRVSIPLTLLLKCFEGPWILVQKRYDKLLDYEAYYSKMDKSKDNRQQVTMTIMKNTFTALNNQLLDELPVLINLSCEVFAECVKAFVLARKLLMGKIMKQYLALFSEISEVNPHQDESLEQFVAKQNIAWSHLINSPLFMKQPRSDTISVGMSKTLSPAAKGSVSASNSAPNSQSSSQQAYLQSYYHVSKLYQVTENYTAKEYLELSVIKGQLLAVIKKQNPMGDSKIWFVDNGATQGFVPCFCLAPVQNKMTDQSKPDPEMSQTEKPSVISHTSLPQRLYDDPPEADYPPAYDTVTTVVDEDDDNDDNDDDSDDNDTSGHVYEEIKDDELFYVLHDLTKTAEHMLQVSRGQVVKVLYKEDYDGNREWWFVEDKFKNTGYVPANYLSKYE